MLNLLSLVPLLLIISPSWIFFTALQEFRRSFLGFPDGTIDDEELLTPLSALQHLKPCNIYNGEAGTGTGEQKSGTGKMDSDGREIDDRELDGRLMDGQEATATATAKSPGKKY
jgi:hypothetical protein